MQMQQDVSYAAPVEVSDATFTNDVLQSVVPVLLDCWAPWCGPCQRMLPVMHQLAHDLAGEVKVAKLNVDQNPAVSRQFGIRSVPTLLLFRKGKVIGQHLGARRSGRRCRPATPSGSGQIGPIRRNRLTAKPPGGRQKLMSGPITKPPYGAVVLNVSLCSKSCES